MEQILQEIFMTLSNDHLDIVHRLINIEGYVIGIIILGIGNVLLTSLALWRISLINDNKETK